MGVMNWLFGLNDAAKAVGTVADVFRPNPEAEASRAAQIRSAALTQFGAEFQPATSGFDRLINGVNRLPRPMLAFAAIGLFAYAIWAPVEFAVRMQALALVPEPLWWLMGAVVSFYFGARELHHARLNPAPSVVATRAVLEAQSALRHPAPQRNANANPALEALLSE